MQSNSYIYRDDFANSKVGQRPEFWLESATYQNGMKNDWSILEHNGKFAFATLETSKDTMTYLHIFDKNTKMCVDFSLGKGAQNEGFGFIFRMAPEETFVKIGYSFAYKKWYVLQDRADGRGEKIIYSNKEYELLFDTEYSANISLDELNLTFSLNGETVFDFQNDELICNGYGRVGLYTQKCELYINNIEIEFASGMKPNSRTIEYTFGEPEAGFSATQIVDKGDGNYIALSNKGRRAYSSKNFGETWIDITETDGKELLGIQTGYQNILKLSNGDYLSVRDLSFEVYRSKDMLHWEKISQIELDGIYDEDRREYVEKNGRGLYMGHINSMVQFRLKDGTERIFYPIVQFGFEDDEIKMRGSFNCKTIICYSDDNGLNWKQSENDSSDFDLAYVDERFLGNWGECKLIQCPDGVIRKYSSRSFAPVLLYTESFDGGVTWQGLYPIPEIQTAVSSISIKEDIYQKGTFYMLWVNDVPSPSGRGSVRIRLSLAKSTDGINWEYLTDIERMVIRYGADTRQYHQLFQIIDPDIFVSEDYVHIDYGRSVGIKGIADDKLDELALVHGRVGRRYIRIPKKSLESKPWSGENLANVRLEKSIELTKLPQTEYTFADAFSMDGGEVTINYFDGGKSVIPLNSLYLKKYPNMLKTGEQTIVFYNRNFQQISYKINITANVVKRYGDLPLYNNSDS